MQNLRDNFESLIERVQSGSPVKPSELLPYLCLERREERCLANLRLAETFAKIKNLEQARVFVTRAWVLSRFSEDILPLFVKIHSELNDVDSIRGAYKRLGMIESSKGNVAGALKYFNQWQYAYASHQKLDRYQYDFDILESIEQMAEPWRFKEYPHSQNAYNKKIRLAYLMFGMTHMNSVLVKINRMLARYHDKERFNVTFFVPEPKSAVYGWHQARENIKSLEGYGCKVVLAPFSGSDLKRLLGVAGRIYDYKPDILITNAALADFEHYFIASLRPAPIIMGLVQGPPPQFAAPGFDWCISWSKHPLIDTPCNCSLVHIGLDLPERTAIKPCTKKSLGIPEDSRLLMSAGRHAKFQDQGFWRSITSILRRFPDLHYVAVGVSREELSSLNELLSPDVKERIRLLGWRDDCLSIFCLADVVIDTYPSGGGHVLIDAMALGIPFVSFENNYMKTFDQTDWSVADEFVDIPELMATRGDFKQFEATVSELIEDTEYRTKMGNLCKEQIRMSMGNPADSMRKFEAVLLSAIGQQEHKK